MNICHLEELNRLLEVDPHKVIADAESAYEQKILDAATQIRDSAKERPIVLVSGPSGSGKTTTALRLEKILDSWGYEAHTLSMDNYFYGHAESNMPIDEDGQVDLESPMRLDVSLLAEHLDKITQCIPVEAPTFDFPSQRRSHITIPLHRRNGELVILEGIHSLNPQVIGQASEYSIGIYISVHTYIQNQQGQTLSPDSLRLCRRLLRDHLYRGQSYENTIARLRSVSRGETLYIMPHKERACISIDTFLPYELAVYCSELSAGLQQVDDNFLIQEGLANLKSLLSQTPPLSKDLVPANSLIREFVGGLEL